MTAAEWDTDEADSERFWEEHFARLDGEERD